RPGGGHLDRQGRKGVRGRPRAAGGRGVAEHVQPLRPDGGVRRLQGERVRARGRSRGPAAVPAMSQRLAVKKTYKLYIGGAPALAAGNTVVAICSERRPLPGLDLGEVLAVSDFPGGVVNLLAGRRSELAPALGAHRDLNAIVDASGDSALAVELDTVAAETV